MITLIGGTGFIGKHLAIHLHREGVLAATFSRQPDIKFLDTHAPSIKAFNLYQSFETDFIETVENSSSLVFLASTSFPSLKIYNFKDEFKKNTVNYIEILEKVIKINPSIHILFLSSGGTVYGPNHSQPIIENSPTNPTTPYAFSKIVLENYIRFLTNTTDTSYTILRTSNPIGIWHRNPRQGFIGASLENLAQNVPIKIFGNGETIRDYIDADDVAKVLLICIKNHKKSKNKLWNVGSGYGHSLNEVASVIQKVTENNLPIERLPARNSDLAYNVLNCASIKGELGWEANADINEIIKKIWQQKIEM